MKIKKKNAFSLTYLRRGQQFFGFIREYIAGFIVYPSVQTKRGRNVYRVFCAFPIDADSDDRYDHGCGESNMDATDSSSPCVEQNIKSFDDWKSHFWRISNSSHTNFIKRQCAFDMRKTSKIKDFTTAIEANKYIQSHSNKYAMRNIQLRMRTWKENVVKKIPIEAFFYLVGSENGKRLAEEFQDELYAQSSGEIVPIVGIQFPTSRKEFHVTFHNRQPI